MNIKKKIEKVIDYFNEDYDGSKVSWEKYREDFANAILRIFLDGLPKEMSAVGSTSNEGLKYNFFYKGHNDCLSEIKSMLNGEDDENKK